MRSPVTLGLTIVACCAAALGAQDWPQWRGPSRTGSTAAFKAPAKWPDRPTQVWKVAAGIGHSSPVVAGTRVYQFSRIGEQEAVTAYDGAVSSLEDRVLPAARRFPELGVSGRQEIPPVAPVARSARVIQSPELTLFTVPEKRKSSDATDARP